MKNYLSCPKCNKKSIVEIIVGSKRLPSKWHYNCNFCNFKRGQDFSFFDRLLAPFFSMAPLILFFTMGLDFLVIRKGFFIIFGTVITIILGFLISDFYLKARVRKFLSESADTCRNLN